MGGVVHNQTIDWDLIDYREHPDGRRWIAGNDPPPPFKGNRQQRRKQAAIARKKNG